MDEQNLSELSNQATQNLAQNTEAAFESEFETQASSISAFFKSFLEPKFITGLLFFIGAILILLLVYFVLKKIFKKIPDEKMKPEFKNIILKILRYAFDVLIIIYILNLFGVNLNAVFGAAGIVGVALGLAAQTSLGNVISGFFILHERSLKKGDHIKIDETEGNVESIDMLSIKIRTFDNQIVRVPNEMIINSKFENYSVFPKRRINLFMKVSYDTNFADCLPKIKIALKNTALVASKPECEAVCSDFSENGAEIRVAAWTKYSDYITARSNIIVSVTNACKELGVKIQCPLVELKNDDKTACKKEIAGKNEELLNERV